MPSPPPALAAATALGLVSAWALQRIQVVAKCLSKRRGALPWTALARPSRVPRSEVAIGVDFMFAAIGAQIGVLLTSWGTTPKYESNPWVEWLWQSKMSQAQVNIRVLWLVIGVTVVMLFVTRFAGYDRTTNEPTEDFGVFVPRFVGVALLAIVYVFSPEGAA
jgi:hypothetical protein